MGRDKKKDDTLFNGGEDHEVEYVAGLYGGCRDKVRDFLEREYEAGRIKNLTHAEVYALIKKEFGCTPE